MLSALPGCPPPTVLRHLPEIDGPILTSRGKDLAVRAEGEAHHLSRTCLPERPPPPCHARRLVLAFARACPFSRPTGLSFLGTRPVLDPHLQMPRYCRRG